VNNRMSQGNGKTFVAAPCWYISFTKVHMTVDLSATPEFRLPVAVSSG
jgi:hypothetical protein